MTKHATRRFLAETLSACIDRLRPKRQQKAPEPPSEFPGRDEPPKVDAAQPWPRLLRPSRLAIAALVLALVFKEAPEAADAIVEGAKDLVATLDVSVHRASAGDLAGAVTSLFFACVGGFLGLEHCFKLLLANLQRSGLLAVLHLAWRLVSPGAVVTLERLCIVLSLLWKL